MQNGYRLIKYSELPEAFRDEIAAEINLRSVSLLMKAAGSEWIQIGSGTLIFYGGLAGVLTAGHVVDELRKAQRIGFNVSHRTHCLNCPSEIVSFASNYKKESGQDLPDLGFLTLPRQVVTQIEVKEKAFYNLKKRGSRPVEAVEHLHDGAWAIWGSPGELTRFEPARLPDGKLEVHQCQTSFCTLQAVDDYPECDALSTTVDFSNCYGDLPQSFGGYSGGGVWHVAISQDNDGQWIIGDCTLAGVVCRQSEPRGHEQDLICNGPESMLSFLRSMAESSGG